MVMGDTLYRNVYKKIKQNTPREVKEAIVHAQLMKSDRIYARNCLESDLFYSYGGEIAHRFIQKIKREEMTVGRELNANEIEYTFLQMLEGLKNGNCNNRLN